LNISYANVGTYWVQRVIFKSEDGFDTSFYLFITGIEIGPMIFSECLCILSVKLTSKLILTPNPLWEKTLCSYNLSIGLLSLTEAGVKINLDMREMSPILKLYLWKNDALAQLVRAQVFFWSVGLCRPGFESHRRSFLNWLKCAVELNMLKKQTIIGYVVPVVRYCDANNNKTGMDRFQDCCKA
jgi:hypothetical protein